MGKTNNTIIPLLPNSYYHIYNRGNNKQRIFYKEKNYPYFLLKFATYMSAYVDLFAYCLLPNHFHLLVRIKTVEEILESAINDFPLINQKARRLWDFPSSNTSFFNKKKVALTDILQMDITEDMQIKIASWAVMERIRIWLMGYAKAINKQEKLEGSLFRKNIRRKEAEEIDYLKYLIWYIHNNPVHHNLFHSLQEYSHSSYQSLISNKPTKLKRMEVLQLYEGLSGFTQYHKEKTLGYDGNDFKFWVDE